MNVVTTRSSKKVEDSSGKNKEIKESEPTPPKKEVFKEEEKDGPYVSPPLYKPPIPFLQRLAKA